MFFSKKRKTDVTDLFVNGGIATAGIGGKPGTADPLALLRSSGIDTDLIPPSLLPKIASSLAMNSNENNDHAKIKVDCAACNRQVAYGKGKCMYCGKPLELPFSVSGPDFALDACDADGETAASESDEKTRSTGVDFDLGGSL